MKLFFTQKRSRLFILFLFTCLITESTFLFAQQTGTKEIIYTGSFSNRGSKGIYVFQFDRGQGKLEEIQTVTDGKNPSFLALHPNGKYLYAVNEIGAGVVMSFKIDPQTGFLTKMNEQSSAGGGPTHISVDPKGRFVYVSNYGGGSLAIYPVNKDGSLEKASDIIQHTGSGTDPVRQKTPKTHSTFPSANGKFIYTSNLGLDKIMVYRVQKSGKFMTGLSPFVSSMPGSGPRHLALHPNGKFAYSGEEISSMVASYKVNKKTGALTPLERLPMLPPTFTGTNSAGDIHISPDGKFLYASNRGHESLVIYEINKSTGKLKLVGHQNTGGKHSRNFLIDKKGEYVFIANMNTDNVVIFKRDKDTGKLTPTGEEIKIPAVSCIIQCMY